VLVNVIATILYLTASLHVEFEISHANMEFDVRTWSSTCEHETPRVHVDMVDSCTWSLTFTWSIKINLWDDHYGPPYIFVFLCEINTVRIFILDVYKKYSIPVDRPVDGWIAADLNDYLDGWIAADLNNHLGSWITTAIWNSVRNDSSFY